MAKKGSPKARRTAARLAAAQVLYQMRLNDQGAALALREFKAGKGEDAEFVTPDADLLHEIVEGLQARWMDVDGILAAALKEGGRTAVEPLLDCILRAGIYELVARAEDAGIVINDYLNVTTGFYEGSETKLVNAVLDKVSKTVR